VRVLIKLVGLLAVLGAVLGLLGCGNNGAEETTFPLDNPDAYAKVSDIVYVEHSPHPRHTLDLYVPLGAGPFPLIIWVHGGSWKAGDKSRDTAHWRWLAARGYVVASVNYRYSSDAVFPAQIHDLKAAVRWLKANARKYAIAADKVGVVGYSAGGHLASLLATSAGVAAMEDLAMGNAALPSDVQALVAYAPPTDFLQMPADKTCRPIGVAEASESLLIGCPIYDCPELAQQANPIAYIDSNDPPVRLEHGTADCVVPLQQSQLLYEALLDADVPVIYRPLAGFGHTYHVTEQTRLFFDSVLKAEEDTDVDTDTDDPDTDSTDTTTAP